MSKYVSNSQNISGNVPYFWTSGRLCDFDGCDRPDFFPKNINGWFWSANQARLSPTNGSAFHDWSGTGGFSPPRPQPDNREQIQQVAYSGLEVSVGISNLVGVPNPLALPQASDQRTCLLLSKWFPLIWCLAGMYIAIN